MNLNRKSSFKVLKCNKKKIQLIGNNYRSKRVIQENLLNCTKYLVNHV